MIAANESLESSAGPSPSPRPWYRGRASKWLAYLVAFLLVFHIAGGWYFSGEIYSSALAPEASTSTLETPVLAVEGNTVTLSTIDGRDELTIPGLWGLEWADGYGHLSELIATGDDTAEWRFELIAGTAPTVGALTALDERAFPGDPTQAHGIAFSDVTYTSSLGENPAWFIEGSDPTWVVLVHGNGLTRRDVLKPLPAVVAAGHPALVITYRNHPLAPADPSGRLQYGLTEWEDLEAAVQYAVDEGAADVVLVGYSMGAGIVANFLYESSLADRVKGVVLDSPMLDFGASVDLGASNRSLPVVGLPIPPTLTAMAKLIASLRYDLDFGQLDYVDRVDEIVVPILLFHGVEDDLVPVAISDEVADALPGLVEYHRVESAKHLEAWNVDRALYEKALGEFLRGL